MDMIIMKLFLTFFFFILNSKLMKLRIFLNLIQPLLDKFHDVRALQAFQIYVIFFNIILFVWHRL